MHIYFSGVSGVAIGPLAMLALDLGHTVSGSDLNASDIADSLIKRGANVALNQDGTHIEEQHTQQPIDWFVYSSALPSDHPELSFAHQQGIKTSKRAEFINQFIADKALKIVAIAGTHGKTTTTGMLIWLLKELGVPISYSVGTTISFGPAAQYQEGSEYFIYECDEFDRNFLEFKPYLSLITSIDYDHPDTYPSIADYLTAFQSFVSNSQKAITWRNVSDKLQDSHTVVSLDDQTSGINQITLPGHNRHNGWLAVQAAAKLTSEQEEKLIEIINRFPGTSRRFEKLAENLYTDYAHHPQEIASTINMALELNPNVVCVYQPHQNIRQKQLLAEHSYQHCFDKAKVVYWLPTYLSREDGSEVIGTTQLITDTSNPALSQAAQMDDNLWQNIENHREAGDLVLCMSAGDLDPWLRKHIS